MNLQERYIRYLVSQGYTQHVPNLVVKRYKIYRKCVSRYFEQPKYMYYLLGNNGTVRFCDDGIFANSLPSSQLKGSMEKWEKEKGLIV